MHSARVGTEDRQHVARLIERVGWVLLDAEQFDVQTGRSQPTAGRAATPLFGTVQAPERSFCRVTAAVARGVTPTRREQHER